MRLPDYSVLMSVYKNEKAEYLRTAMDSMWNQTVATNDFVLICDGPLTDELDAVIENMQSQHPDMLHVVRLKENKGLGHALRIGVIECRNELIARMDSDDISLPERCEKQLKVFVNSPEISICSGIIEEFTASPEAICAKRILPENHEEIYEFAKKRNPFNHPCVMYKKNAVITADGYRDFYLLEDYYLWVRMLEKGFKGYNLQESLLYMRAGSDMYKRRAGLKYAKSQRKLFRYMKKTGFITGGQYIKSSAIRTCSSVAPNWLREKAFKKILRNN